MAAGEVCLLEVGCAGVYGLAGWLMARDGGTMAMAMELGMFM